MRIATCRATREERRGPMLGDHLVPEPILSFTHAIDLGAPPERVWPWLAQMGAGRAGWYSWDRIDNGGRRSADRLVPELQGVEVGDLMPAVPGATEVFVVAEVEPPYELLLRWPAGGGETRATWEFALAEAGSGTRLVVRARLGARALEAARGAPGPDASLAGRIEAALLRLPLALLRRAGALGHRVMQARQLRGLRRRIERRPALGWLARSATEDERARAMPGDELVERPAYCTTRAITIRAAPAHVWPWLVQMGRGRGGLYSIDWLDRLLGVLDGPSADRVLPEWQALAAGDAIPVGRTAWPVHAVDRERSLVLRVAQGEVLLTQAWALYPLDAETTRLVLRIRAAFPLGARYRALAAALAPQELVMVRAQLRGIRRRAEALAAAQRGRAGARG